MTPDEERFEKFLKSRLSFLRDMLLIVKDPPLRECYQVQLDEVGDIIHHFNVIVKGEISTGLGVENE